MCLLCPVRVCERVHFEPFPDCFDAGFERVNVGHEMKFVSNDAGPNEVPCRKDEGSSSSSCPSGQRELKVTSQLELTRENRFSPRLTTDSLPRERRDELINRNNSQCHAITIPFRPPFTDRETVECERRAWTTPLINRYQGGVKMTDARRWRIPLTGKSSIPDSTFCSERAHFFLSLTVAQCRMDYEVKPWSGGSQTCSGTSLRPGNFQLPSLFRHKAGALCPKRQH